MTRIVRLAATVAVIAAIGWVGWWFVAARGHEEAISRWFAARAAEGWQAELAEVETTGFPARFVTRLDRPALADPDAGWAWSAPELRFESPAFDPTNVTAIFPPEQAFGVPGETAKIGAGRMEALLSLYPGIDLQLREGAFTTEGLTISGQSGWEAAAKQLRISVARRDIEGEPPETHELKALAEAVVLPEVLLRRIDPSGLLSPALTALRIEGLFVPDRPLDRHVIEDGRLGARTVVIRQAALDWDGMGIEASGRLDADAEGRAAGKIDLELRQWRRLLALARSSGALPDGIADAVEGALEFIALLSRSDALEVSVTFADGRARIGPVNLGDAPRLLAPPRASRRNGG